MARKKAIPQASTEALEPRVYELGFLLSPAIREEDLDSKVDEIKSIITDASGEILTDARPEFIDIAYQMDRVIDNKRVKFNQGYFGWIKFTLTPDQIKVIQVILDKDIQIIRSLLTLTVAENTIISKKPLSKILKSSARGEMVEDEVVVETETETDTEAEEIDPGMAAIELQTPTNDDVVEPSPEIVTETE